LKIKELNIEHFFHETTEKRRTEKGARENWGRGEWGQRGIREISK
jgi:hypothetical protein